MKETMVFLKSVDVPEGLAPKERSGFVSEKGHDYVRSLMSSATGENYSHIPFSRQPGGKPYFEECRYHFSLSHCGTLLAVAISGAEVGIDIEKIRLFNERVAKRYFTADERNYFDAGKDDAERSRRGFEIWTAKEAYLKLHGVGIAGGLDFDTANSSGLLKQITSEKYPAAYLQSTIKEITLKDGTNDSVAIALCGSCSAENQVRYHII